MELNFLRQETKHLSQSSSKPRLRIWSNNCQKGSHYRGEQKEDARASKRYFASPASELVRFLLKDASVRSAVKVTKIEKSGDQYVLTLDDTEKQKAFDAVYLGSGS